MKNLRSDITEMFSLLTGIPERFGGSLDTLQRGYRTNFSNTREAKRALRAKKRAKKAKQHEWRKRKAHSKRLREQARKEYLNER